MTSKPNGLIAWSVLDETFSGLSCFSYHAVFIYHAFSCSASGYHFLWYWNIMYSSWQCSLEIFIHIYASTEFWICCLWDFTLHAFWLMHCVPHIQYRHTAAKTEATDPYTHAYTCTNKHTSAAAETLEWPLFLHLSFSMSFSHLCLVLWSFWVLIFSQGASCGNTWCQ